MTLAILCSGQGGQHAGMFDLTGAAPAAAGLFAEATRLLGHDPRDWVRSASVEELHVNRTAQLLCTLQALSAAAALGDALPSRRCVAGYSVGEIAAWNVAGLIEAADTLKLVAARAEAMDAASGGDEGMLFVRGLDPATVTNLCTGREAAIAIINPGNACVLAGKRAALADIAAEALRHGAVRAVPVAVNVASHTRFLAGASSVFRTSLAQLHIARAPHAGTRLLCGIDGAAVLDIAAGIDKLALQISQPVQWAACLESCVEAGANAFLELGPGRALADMASSAYPAIPARSLDDFRSLSGVRNWLAGQEGRNQA